MAQLAIKARSPQGAPLAAETRRPWYRVSPDPESSRPPAACCMRHGVVTTPAATFCRRQSLLESVPTHRTKMHAALVPLLIAVINAIASGLVWAWLAGRSIARRRAAFCIATASFTTLLLLGIAWPSPFTLAAVAVLPAAVSSLWGLLRPRIARHRWLRIYSVSAMLLAAASYAVLAAFWFVVDVQWRPG